MNKIRGPGIIDNLKYCKKHNCIHSQGEMCPHCRRELREAADKKEELKLKKQTKKGVRKSGTSKSRNK